jgi:hypothetical protein
MAKGSGVMVSEPLKRSFSGFNKSKRLNILEGEPQQETFRVHRDVHRPNSKNRISEFFKYKHFTSTISG